MPNVGDVARASESSGVTLYGRPIKAPKAEPHLAEHPVFKGHSVHVHLGGTVKSGQITPKMKKLK